MMARRLAWALGLALLVWLVCIAYAVRSSSWLWVVAPPVAVAGLHAIGLVCELILQRVISRRDGAPTFSVLRIPMLVVRELVAAWRAFAWDVPFLSRRFTDAASGTAPRRPGVVLIHGLFCNRGIWNAWIAEFTASDIPFVAVDLEPLFGSIDTYMPTIDAAVNRLNRATGSPVIVVGHSMGGLAARAWMATRADDGMVHRVVTIGSPHHGTVMSRFSRATNARQMAPGSEWLKRLAAREQASPTDRFTCFYSDCDNVILPWTSARLAGADNRFIALRPHLALLHAPAVLNEVMRLLREMDATG